MRNLLIILFILIFTFLSVPAFAGKGALKLPEGSNASAIEHNKKGIFNYVQGYYGDALKSFQLASKVDPSVGESHYNEALCLDKLGKHEDATKHFYKAREYAKGNSAILKSKILNAHSPVMTEGSHN
jgi:tetratricopeptide (TPR) repeat protein|tara:strand:+ start:421 stop:801 length:381 start_codon:yes stop_codon:yes gene_type:complete